MKNGNWKGDASKSSGVTLVLISILSFLLSLNIIGLLPLSLKLFPIPMSINDIIQTVFPITSTTLAATAAAAASVTTNNDMNIDIDITNTNTNTNMMINETLPMSLLLPLTTIPTLFWLIVKYVSLRLHLGRN
jgi:hypothetical protein